MFSIDLNLIKSVTRLNTNRVFLFEFSPSVFLIRFQSSELRVRLAEPTQLQPKPDVDDLSFGKYFTDHMLKVYWHKALGGWQKPEITPMENLVLHPAAKVLHYAVEVSDRNLILRCDRNIVYSGGLILNVMFAYLIAIIKICLHNVQKEEVNPGINQCSI